MSSLRQLGEALNLFDLRRRNGGENMGAHLLSKKPGNEFTFFDIFNRLILGSVHGGGGGQSELTLLDQDTETSTYIKMLIAEYAGVPFGPQIRRARQALWNASVLAASAARGYLHLVIS